MKNRRILHLIGVSMLSCMFVLGNVSYVHAEEETKIEAQAEEMKEEEKPEEKSEEQSKESEEQKSEQQENSDSAGNASGENESPTDKKDDTSQSDKPAGEDQNIEPEEPAGAANDVNATIEVPDLTGSLITEAEETLKSLNIACIKNYEYSLTAPVDTIISQDIVGNTTYLPEETAVTVVISLGIEPTETATEDNTTFGWSGRMGGSAISIDGNCSDWDDKPASWMYNWAKPGPYSEKTHHKISLCCDGENVFLYIKFAEDFGERFNGYNYMFYIDGEPVQFVVTDVSGTAAPGTYRATVRHGDGSVSWSVAEGAEACLKVNNGGINNELELKIPFKTMEIQNANIQPHEVSDVKYSSGNITGSVKVSCEGASTGPVGFACAVLLAVPISCALIRKYYTEKRA